MRVNETKRILNNQSSVLVGDWVEELKSEDNKDDDRIYWEKLDKRCDKLLKTINGTETTLENTFNIKQYPILDVDCVEEFKSEDNREELDGILENKVPSGNFDLKKTKFHEWDVMKVTEDWRTIDTGSRRKNRPFGDFYSNVWNHEWSEQFINYEKNEERNESNHLCENREFWTEKMIPLMKEEDSDWESSSELDDRLDDMNEIASRYSTSYQMNQ